MAGKRKKDNTRDESTIVNTNTFRYYLYTNRSKWTGHIIPVRYKDNEIGVFMEGYITSALSKKSDESEEESEIEEFEETNSYDLTLEKETLVTIRSAHISIKTPNFKKVRYEDLYPSKRLITLIENPDKMGPINLIPLYNEDMTLFDPVEKPSLDKIVQVFNLYPGIQWTLPEIASILNRSIEEVKDYIITNFTESYQRNCKITNTIQATYMQKVLQAQKLEQNGKAHQVVGSVEKLYANYSDCTNCDLGIKRIERNCNIVPARGNSKSPKFMFIGEAPGLQEELNGIPFNPDAPAGGLFKEALITAGFDKKDCYITNAVICRPLAEKEDKAQNSKPKLNHIKACLSRLKNEIVIVNPKIIVLLGKTAFEAYFGREPDGVLKSVGWVMEEKVYFVVHPSYIARQIGTTTGKAMMGEYINHFKTILEAGNRPI